VCSPCADRSAVDLARIVDLAPEVEAAIAKLARFGGSVSSSREHPLPVDLRAGERGAAIGNTVATWARHVSEQRGVPIERPPRVPPRTVGPLCRLLAECRHEACERIRTRHVELGPAVAAAFLAGQLEWLRHRREALEAFGELRDAARDLERLVGRPRDLWYAGPCQAELADGSECKADLYAAPAARTVRCRECKAEHDAAALREWLLTEAVDVLAHAELIARALTALEMDDVTPARVRGMARHGRLVAHGVDPAGRPLYRVGDVLDVIEEQEQIEQARAQVREEKAARRAARQAARHTGVNCA